MTYKYLLQLFFIKKNCEKSLLFLIDDLLKISFGTKSQILDQLPSFLYHSSTCLSIIGVLCRINSWTKAFFGALASDAQMTANLTKSAQFVIPNLLAIDWIS